MKKKNEKKKFPSSWISCCTFPACFRCGNNRKKGMFATDSCSALVVLILAFSGTSGFSMAIWLWRVPSSVQIPCWPTWAVSPLNVIIFQKTILNSPFSDFFICESCIDVLLALNRCLSILCPKIEDMLFKGSMRYFLWKKYFYFIFFPIKIHPEFNKKIYAPAMWLLYLCLRKPIMGLDYRHQYLCNLLAPLCG